MLEKILDYIRNFNFTEFFEKIKNRNVQGEVKEKTKEIIEDVKGKEEDFVYKAKHWKLFEGFHISNYTSFVNIKIAGVLIAIIVILFCIMLLIKFTGMYADKSFEEFTKNIELVESKIISIYDANEEKVGKGTNELAKRWKYKKHIKNINNEFGIDITTSSYYFLDKEEKEKLGLSDLKNEYIVNYEQSTVFSLKPNKYKGKKYYTSIKIENAIKGVATYDMPPIPKGFRHVEGLWNTGFVIKDNYENEFVWIPVGYLNDKDPSKALSKYYREYNSKTEETEEYKAIIASINKYQGFYIGRYESSLQGATNISDEGNSNVLQVKKNILPVSRLSYSTNKSNISENLVNEKLSGYDENGNNIIAQYDENNGLTNNVKGALELAKDMSLSYDWGQEGVHTALMYAEQYDTTIKIIEKLKLLDDKKVDDLNPITEDSSNWGNYMNTKIRYKLQDQIAIKDVNEGKLLPTGATTYNIDNDNENSVNEVFNIYDLAGNLSEWSMDRILGVYNNVRGGSFSSRGNRLQVSEYNKQYQNASSTSIGLRVVLYID